ncbi:MAG: dTDP-4-dehydrorhamnose 3,5-epimerase [Arenimonas sp.]
MKLVNTPLQGLFEIHTDSLNDSRGRFTRLFCEQELAAIRPRMHFTQINLSDTKQKGSIRGLHYQHAPAAEAKLIRCLRGRVFDVAVDIRKNSPSFLQWHAVELSESNNQAIFIPEGFAHGFQSLSDDVQLLYMHTANWSPPHESGLRHDDPKIAIHWPLSVSNISEKDAGLPLIQNDFAGVES